MPEQKQQWENFITSSYPEGGFELTPRAVVCDLHFDENDMVKRMNKTILNKGSCPKHVYVFHSAIT